MERGEDRPRTPAEAPIIDIARVHPDDKRTEWRMQEIEEKLQREDGSDGKVDKVDDEALREILEEIRKAPKLTRWKKWDW